ncbi:MAG: M48 family metallopeptidase [Magnetococcus sp. MYC-9]
MASGQGVILLQGREVSYLLVRVRSRKRLGLLLDGQGVLQVRVPWRATQRQAEQFLQAHAPWVLQQLATGEEKRERPPLQMGDRLPFLDDTLQLQHGTGQIRPLFREGDRLWVAEGYGSPAELIGLLESWYRQQAHGYLPDRLQSWASRMGLSFARLSIRSQRSRWGSCSSKKSINLNWRLMCLPSWVADYVMVHELCHLSHMNHSPEFWALLARFLPHYPECRRQLRLFSPPW